MGLIISYEQWKTMYSYLNAFCKTLQKVPFVFTNNVFIRKRQTRGHLSEGKGNRFGRFPYGCFSMFAVQGSLHLEM